MMFTFCVFVKLNYRTTMDVTSLQFPCRTSASTKNATHDAIWDMPICLSAKRMASITKSYSWTFRDRTPDDILSIECRTETDLYKTSDLYLPPPTTVRLSDSADHQAKPAYYIRLFIETDAGCKIAACLPKHYFPRY